MVISISMNQVLIFISIIALIAGTIVIYEITKTKEIIPLLPAPFSSKEIVNVEPKSSQQGTTFVITATSSKTKEEQDAYLIVQNGNFTEQILLFDNGKFYDSLPRDGIYGGFFNSEGKPIGQYEIKNKNKILATFSIYKPDCSTIYESKLNTTKIKFLILPHGYSDYFEFENDAKNLLLGKDSILTKEPFASNLDKLSFSIVPSYQDMQCEIGCKKVPTAICCNDKIVVQEASKCQYDYLIVLIKNKEICGSASFYAKICSKNPLSNMVLMHELGHSFGNLADEYTYEEVFGDYSIGEFEVANCDVLPCTKWNEITTNCFQGCTYSSLYRSEEKESIMYDYIPVYNKVCQNQIQKVINNYVNTKAKYERPAKSYFVSMEYNNGNISIKNIFLKPVQAPITITKSQFSAKITNKQGNVIYSSFINVPIINFPIIGPSSIPTIQNNFEFATILPFSNNAEILEIQKDNSTIASASLAPFSNNCGNNVCDSNENHILCKEDCSIKDGFCQTSSCDPDCPSQKGCEQKRIAYFIISILVIIAIIAAIYIIIKRKSD
ncbi:MAG: M64 family metallopeptidase [Candidatus Pacearchaeota archaeon]|nr:M64 family metallopeptidase [Candidatus Pacearchaeota archaeon]